MRLPSVDRRRLRLLGFGKPGLARAARKRPPGRAAREPEGVAVQAGRQLSHAGSIGLVKSRFAPKIK